MVYAIIVAGGKGLRMKTAVRKQYILLEGCPVLGRTIKTFSSINKIDKILVPAPLSDFDFIRSRILAPMKLDKRISLVPGGKTRQESVFNALRSIPGNKGLAVIHDGVRPFADHENIIACIETAEKTGACILGSPVFDTIKKTDSSGAITKTMPRKGIWLAQTPQVFELTLIKSAHEKAKNENYPGTDDASLVERLGHPVKIISGSKFNIKITTSQDLILARAIIRALSCP